MRGLRIAVATAGVAALAGLQTTGLLPFPLVALVCTVFLLGCWAAPRLQRSAGSGLRFAAGFGVSALIMAAALQATGVRDGRGLLAVAAVAVMATTAAEHTSRRSLMFGLALAVAVLSLALALAPGIAVLLPAAVVWVAGLVALVLAQRLAEAEPAAAAGVPAAGMGPAPAGASRADVLRARGRWVALPVLGCLLVGVAAATALPRLTSPGGDAGGEGRQAGGGPVRTLAAGTPGRSAAAYTSGVLDLRSRGELSGERLYDVPAASPGLWRGAVLDRYDGTTWRGTRQRPAPVGGPGTITVRPAPDDGIAEDRPERTDTVRMTPAAGGLIVAPGVVDRLDTPLAVVLGDTGQLTLESASAAAYTVGSRPPDSTGAKADAAALRAATGTDPGDPRWTQLPSGVPARVRDLGRRLAGPGTERYAAVLGVQHHLRDVATYRLDSPVPPPGADAVDDFLFVSRSGFCEQFASAEVVLLRSAGVPARLVTGFSGGVPSGPGRRAVVAADAHAWVEVWFPGRGWVSSDPTAGVRPDTSWQDRIGRDVAELAAGSRGRTLLALLAVGLIATLAVIALLVTRWLRSAPAGTGESRPGPRRGGGLPPPLLAAYQRLEVALAEAGRPRAPTESAADLAARWADDAEAARAFGTLQLALYGPLPPPPAEVAAAAAHLDTLSASLLARQPH